MTSSGFATSGYVRWYAKQHQRVLDNREWVKAHIMVGVNTGVVTSVEISDWTANDNPFLIPLVQDTAERFEIREVSADKQYVGRAKHHRDRGDRGDALHPLQSQQRRDSQGRGLGVVAHVLLLRLPP